MGADLLLAGHRGVDGAIEQLQAQGIHSVLAQFCDIHGVARGKLMPLGLLREMVETGAGFSGPSIWGTGLPRHGPRSEYYGRVQIDTLRPLPFWPGVAHAVCDGFAGGEPLGTCSRQTLKRQLGLLQDRGWTLWVGIEPEFFLMLSSIGIVTGLIMWAFNRPLKNALGDGTPAKAH